MELLAQRRTATLSNVFEPDTMFPGTSAPAQRIKISVMAEGLGEELIVFLGQEGDDELVPITAELVPQLLYGDRARLPQPNVVRFDGGPA